MFRYTLKDSQGNIKAGVELSEDITNPWQDKFDKFGRKGFNGGHDREWPAVLDDDGVETEPAIAKSMTIEKEDISAEIAAREAAEQARRDARARLKARNDNAPVTPADFDDLLKSLGIK